MSDRVELAVHFAVIFLLSYGVVVAWAYWGG